MNIVRHILIFISLFILLTSCEKEYSAEPSEINKEPSDSVVLTVWSKSMCEDAGQIIIKVGDESAIITAPMQAQPQCRQPGTASFKLPKGNYAVIAICGNDTISYKVFAEDECSFLEVSYADKDYLPLTSSSYWDYVDKYDASRTHRFTAAAEELISGVSYTRYSSDFGRDCFFRKESGVYYQYRELGFQDFVEDPPSIEIVILKDKLAKGDKWETNPIQIKISGVIKDVKLVSTIVDRDYSDIINGVRYDNLIKVNTELLFAFEGGDRYAASGSSFNTIFGRGKGIVSYNDFDVNVEWQVSNLFVAP